MVLNGFKKIIIEKEFLVLTNFQFRRFYCNFFLDVYASLGSTLLLTQSVTQSLIEMENEELYNLSLTLSLHYICTTFALYLHYLCTTFAISLHYLCTISALSLLCAHFALALHQLCIALHSFAQLCIALHSFAQLCIYASISTSYLLFHRGARSPSTATETCWRSSGRV